ncbi:hypothetical protein C4566_03275 [Candidatus Parcubacteria bacterium]|nr:MAG: hypothetical protein C4566_03275 [Candidatus Parcubacteria bacterium]
MSIKRMIVVADDYDLEVVSRALISIGVKAEHIHISRDQTTTALAELGVESKQLPPGPILIGFKDKQPWASDVP